jgi:hypothetical protein
MISSFRVELYETRHIAFSGSAGTFALRKAGFFLEKGAIFTRHCGRPPGENRLWIQ